MRRTEMMARVLAVAGAVVLTLSATPAASAQDPQKPYPPELYQPRPTPQEPAASQDFQPFTAEQLDNLVAPIALYADPLLAQVLLAATFPDELADAATYVQANGTDGIDDQPWDVSVKAVAHYPTVLNMMTTKSDWTTSLGQAYAAQSTEVMQAIQRMRRMAQAQGNLVTSPEQEVLVEPDYIRIWPANPRYIYVPIYDPDVVYIRPVFVRPGFHTFFSFGLPFRIGPWLIYDWDWPAWRIYYTGWAGGGWIARSRPFVSITNVYYVNPLHRRVWYGRDVLRRHPDYGRIRRYEPIHPGLRYPGDDRSRRRGGESSPPGRRAEPRSGTVVTPPRPVPMATQPSGAGRARQPIDHGAGIDRPRSAPVQNPPTVDQPRPVQRQPSAEQPRPAPVDRQPSPEIPRWTPPARQPSIDQPRSSPVERPRAPEIPRWTPPQRQPSADQPRSAPAESRPQVYERPRTYERPQPAERPQPVERPRVESRPAVQQPRVESQPRVEQRPQAQPSGSGDRGGHGQDQSHGQDRAQSHDHH